MCNRYIAYSFSFFWQKKTHSRNGDNAPRNSTTCTRFILLWEIGKKKFFINHFATEKMKIHLSCIYKKATINERQGLVIPLVTARRSLYRYTIKTASGIFRPWQSLIYPVFSTFQGQKEKKPPFRTAFRFESCFWSRTRSSEQFPPLNAIQIQDLHWFRCYRNFRW